MLYPTELRARPEILYHRRLLSASRRGVLAGVVGMLWGWRGAAAADAVRVREVVRADEWLLGDGRVVRLASIVVPGLPAAVEPAARELMAAFAGERPFELAESGKVDRYGRILGTLLDERQRDPRAQLLRTGLAVVRVGDEPGEAVRALLVEEKAGRVTGSGVWGELDQAVVTPDGVAARIGRFALVEGVVVSVTERWEATFLDFGADWRTDFTIRIRKADLPLFQAAGIQPSGLVGRKVAARGWPFLASGPMLEMRDPLELQPLP